MHPELLSISKGAELQNGGFRPTARLPEVMLWGIIGLLGTEKVKFLAGDQVKSLLDSNHASDQKGYF